MIHLRIVSPTDRTDAVLELLHASPSVINVIVLRDAARRPDGDAILCDVAREDASVIISDLKDLGLYEDGSIALELIDTAISRKAREAERYAPGTPSDAVVWEEVEERTSENVELSGVFLMFMVLASLIAAVGIIQDSPILIVGAMVVGPEFGPIAGFCVALVQRRKGLALRSAVALVVGFPLAILGTYVATHVFKATGITPDTFSEADHQLSNIISSPDFLAVFVAVCAGAAGMLSLSTAKSGALIGVLISVTTIPAAANIGVAAAYQDWPAWRGSIGQLTLNMAGILVAGTSVLAIQRMLYRRRRARRSHAETSYAHGIGTPAAMPGPDLSAPRARTRRRSSSAPSRPPHR
jgi:uncharacterized hydrophobic protein (TIGR00271 family)